uniref:Uncharacterized protein n=1 Tax=viral metagenome TaxID=1070528 RepID=A0A6C0BLP5_9ZZZZ
MNNLNNIQAHIHNIIPHHLPQELIPYLVIV